MAFNFGAAPAPAPAAPAPAAAGGGSGGGFSFGGAPAAPAPAATPTAPAAPAAAPTTTTTTAATTATATTPGNTTTTATTTLRKSLRELGVGAAGLGSSSSFPAGAADSNPTAIATARPALNGTPGTAQLPGGNPASASALSYASEAAAHRLLARSGGGFDSAQFGRDARELETRTSGYAGHHQHHTHGTGTAAAVSGIGGMGMQAEPRTPFGVRSGLLSGSGGGGIGGATPAGGGATRRSPANAASTRTSTGTSTLGGPDGGGGISGGGRALFGSSTATAAHAAAHAGTADLSTYLSAHHAANVARILDSTRLGAERSANAIIRARLEQDWLTERMHIVGTCRSTTSSAGSGSGSGSLSGGGASGAAGDGIAGGGASGGGGLAARLAQEAQAAAHTPHQPNGAGRIGGSAAAAATTTPRASLRFGPSGAPTPYAYDATTRSRYSYGDGGGDGAVQGILTTLNSVSGTATTTTTTIAGPAAGVANFALDAARVVPPAPLNERSIGDHATLVAALNHSRRGTQEGGQGRRRAAMSAEQFVDGVRSIVSSGVGTYSTSGAGTRDGLSAASLSAAQTVDRGYLTALDITSSLLLMSTNTGADGSASTNRPSCRTQTLGSLHHLAEQYRSHILATVSRSAMTGSSSASSFGEGGSDGFAAQVAAYVNLELGQVSATGATSGAAVSPWRRVYHCLRCGDLAAALATLECIPSTGGNDLIGAADVATVAAAIKCLSNFQGAKRSMWLVAAGASEPGSNGIEKLLSSVPSDVRSSMAELRHTAQVTSTGGNTGGDSAYLTACLSLLCLDSTSQINDGGADAGGGNGASSAASTVEDYLYEGLWGAFFQQKFDATAAAISSLGESVRHFGPSHFEDDGDVLGSQSLGITSRANKTPLSGGWAFAIPLIICQQFESALTYLAKVGGPAGLLQATHIGLTLYLGGIELVDLRAPHPSASSSGSILLTSLLSSYASALSSSAALEYLILIPDSASHAGPTAPMSTVSRTAKAYVQSLIVESGAFEDLAGVMGLDGNRMCPDGSNSNAPGLLDTHFSPSEISDLLCAASSEALRRGRGQDAAELLSLAGRYTALLSLLNSELASLLVVEDPADQELADKRAFWRTAGDNFHSIHLRGGPNHVLAALEAENRLDLTSTFALIMNLMVFFDRCQIRDWEGAWSLIDEIGLFPSEEETMSRNVANYQALDTALKGKPFRRAVLYTMESLYQQHSALKGRLGGSQSSQEAGTINQRLGDLRRRARLLVTFAGLCRLDGDVSAKIARMEAYMV